MDTTITGAVIVKDEERCIQRCLDTLLPLVDEVIIVDTGSLDNTVNIINNYQSDKIKLFNISWNDDFSEARNYAIQKSTCDYILFLDADEYIVTPRDEFSSSIRMLDNNENIENIAFCPGIKDHNSNISTSVRRLFKNNNSFFYSGFVHEELRCNAGSDSIADAFIDIEIHHDGYLPTIFNDKDKDRRNHNLNLKNVHAEPTYLRWIFFYHRDSFDTLNAEDIYVTLAKSIKRDASKSLDATNLKNDPYTFSILDLMARAKIKTRNNHDEFYTIVKIMNHIIPMNSNGFYYSLIYDILSWKDTASARISEIIEFKKSDKQYNIDMLHSDGLHIDAALSFYLYEIGLIDKAKELLLSVKSCGFQTELVDNYLNHLTREY